ncbi:hypothetical protein SPHINGOR109_51107 [Sphingorhabdus sp. 109]|nr:hypothetical protein SPHINGOR109_51107 [Sphingorhabdus sp. 109]
MTHLRCWRAEFGYLTEIMIYFLA